MVSVIQMKPETSSNLSVERILDRPSTDVIAGSSLLVTSVLTGNDIALVIGFVSTAVGTLNAVEENNRSGVYRTLKVAYGALRYLSKRFIDSRIQYSKRLMPGNQEILGGPA